MGENTMTEQQERFAIEYAQGNSATQSAKNAGYSEEHAGNQGYRLTKNDEVMKKVEEVKSQMAEDLRSRMAQEASSAFNVLVEIMNNDEAKDSDRIKCAVDLLDRAGYVAEKKVEIKTNEDRSLDRLRQDMAYNDLRTGNTTDTE